MQRIILLSAIVCLLGISNVWASNNFNLPIQINSGYLHWVKASQNKNDIFITGTVNKPLGKDLNRAKILISFYDETGQKIIEKYTDISVLRTHTHRGDKGRFILRVPYQPSMKSCQITLVWKNTVKNV